jgi:hypothetical protein
MAYQARQKGNLRSTPHRIPALRHITPSPLYLLSRAIVGYPAKICSPEYDDCLCDNMIVETKRDDNIYDQGFLG